MLTTIRELDASSEGELNAFRAAYTRWWLELEQVGSVAYEASVTPVAPLAPMSLETHLSDLLNADEMLIFLIYISSQLAGFAVIDSSSTTPVLVQRSPLAGSSAPNRSSTHRADYALIDFFIERDYRRRGIGAEAARLLFLRFRGTWQISQLESDRHAIEFWRTTLKRVSSHEFFESRASGRLYQWFRS
jgi:GNAT superfamily N-acetyltransferase